MCLFKTNAIRKDATMQAWNNWIGHIVQLKEYDTKSYSFGADTGRPLSALNSHGVMGPFIIISESRITTYSASVFTWLIQCTTAAGLLIGGYLTWWKTHTAAKVWRANPTGWIKISRSVFHVQSFGVRLEQDSKNFKKAYQSPVNGCRLMDGT